MVLLLLLLKLLPVKLLLHMHLLLELHVALYLQLLLCHHRHLCDSGFMQMERARLLLVNANAAEPEVVVAVGLIANRNRIAHGQGLCCPCARWRID